MTKRIYLLPFFESTVSSSWGREGSGLRSVVVDGGLALTPACSSCIFLFGAEVAQGPLSMSDPCSWNVSPAEP